MSSYIKFSLSLFLICLCSNNLMAMPTAVDWSDFAGSGGALPFYTETEAVPGLGNVTIQVDRAGLSFASLTTDTQNDVTITGAPWTPIPSSMISVVPDSSPSAYIVQLISSTALLLPGQYLAVGGLSPGPGLSIGLIFDGAAQNLAYTNYDVTGPVSLAGTKDLAYDSNTGAISFVSGTSSTTSGALVFQNTTGSPISQVTFFSLNIPATGSSPVFFAVTTPEPSTYLLMGSALLFLLLVSRKKVARKKCS